MEKMKYDTPPESFDMRLALKTKYFLFSVFKIFFFFLLWLIYNVLSISAVQQSEDQIFSKPERGKPFSFPLENDLGALPST